jgi:hypothetical protein
MAGLREAPLPAWPLVLTLTSNVAPLTISRTKTSVALLVSPATKSLALLSNAAYWPLEERLMGRESPLPPPVPRRLTLTKLVVPLVRSRRKTFSGAGIRVGRVVLLVSRARLLAVLVKSTYRPSGLRMGVPESPLPPAGGCREGSTTDTNCHDWLIAGWVEAASSVSIAAHRQYLKNAPINSFNHWIKLAFIEFILLHARP